MVVEQPVLFVGSLTGADLDRAAVNGGGGKDPMLVDLAGRLARATGSDGGDGCDLIVQAAGSEESRPGDRDVTFVRVLSAAEDRRP